MKSHLIRERFLGYFEQANHRRVKSSSLIPAEDPTLLFTNAGMVQFKDCFLGLHDPGYRRATTAQKCIRAGGKHNDLENVGFTPRHHTFFEMLGNFSFGDYFKKEAIAFAWELLTREYGLPKDRLRVTVFKDDDEAFELWKAQGVPSDWIVRLEEKDNFWAMGDTGPCGPCTEIHFDWGDKYRCDKPDCAPGCPCDKRFLEIWNLVFMQFNRDSSGKLSPLPKPSVDTGAGLERISAVLQNVYSNYDTDLFQPLIQAIGRHVGRKYGANSDDDVSMRVIADHLRSSTFLMADGISPSNEGRGYVLRRILRRAIRHGKKLGQEKPFIHTLVPEVVGVLGSFYPELSEKMDGVLVQIKEEETRFHQTLHRGMGVLDDHLKTIKAKGKNVLSGEIAFKLYDSYGFPLDLVEIICGENGLTVDESAFHSLMEKQRSQSSWDTGTSDAQKEITRTLEANKPHCQFVGYERLTERSRLVRLWNEVGKEVEVLSGKGFALAEATPFYAESGGQVGDSGVLNTENARCCVERTLKIAGVSIHQIKVESGSLHVGESAEWTVDRRLRKKTAINHTATHLLHASLREVLGERVKQAGSLVEPSRLRFDFAFPRAVAAEEIERVEKLVNKQIHASLPVETREMGYDEAIKRGALAFFDDKYGDRVRVVRVGAESAFSTELCGGTHLKNIANILLFKIVSESSVASGVRRIEAITADTALELLHQRDATLKSIETQLGVYGPSLVSKIDSIQAEGKALRKETEKLQLALAGGSSGQAPWDKKIEIRDLQVVMERVPGGNPEVLRTLADQIRDKLKQKAVVVLATQSEGKVSLCVGLSKDLVGRLDAGKLIKPLAADVNGTGGGKPDFAQAGGSNPNGLDRAFANLRSLLEKQDVS